MTRINAKTVNLTAIILCILIILSSVCPYVSISDIDNGNTQFFAAKLYLAFAQTVTSLSALTAPKTVSWIRNREIVSDTQITDRKEDFSFSIMGDMPHKYTAPFNVSFPQKCGPSRYFMRI